MLISNKSKIRRVLSALSNGDSYNRFEAEKELHDHTLYATVHTIQNHHGIHVSRKDEVIPGYMGAKTRCCRYWLDKEQQQKAKNLLTEK